MVLVEDYEIIPFGVKHRSKNINTVIAEDPSYAIWCLRQPFLDNYPEMKKIIESHFKTDDIVLWFGKKHKGKTLTYIKEHDPKYICWLKQYDYVLNNEKAAHLKEALEKL
jgi:hypothetical protein